MSAAVMIMMVFACMAVFLRGGELHNYLVDQAESICIDAGFSTSQEHPEPLPGGGLDFVDLLAKRGELVICVEVETTARNVVSNAHKARRLGLPLVVLVPSKKVQRAAIKALARSGICFEKKRICFSLLGQLQQALTNCLSLFFAANGGRKNRKTNQIKEKNHAD